VWTELRKPGPARTAGAIGSWRPEGPGGRRIAAASRGVGSCANRSVVGCSRRRRCVSAKVRSRCQEHLVSASASPTSARGRVRMGLTTGGRGEHTDPACDDAFDGFSGFGVSGKRGVLDALFKFVAFGSCAFLGGNGFVDVGGHREEMRSGRFVTRLFLAERDASGVRLQRVHCGFRRKL
jgi:hypothetical protein